MNNSEKIIGVWHRPNSGGGETDLEGLRSVLDEFKAAGINIVFLETFYHGMTVFKTDKVGYNDKLAAFSYGDYPDYLTAFALEAEKRGINVYAWVQDFYVGVVEETPLVRDHLDWMLINQSGGIRHTTEGQGFGGYLFFDPANPEVTDFLTGLYDELLTRLPVIKGLNLDYIRYPVSVIEDDTDTGYTKVSMQSFANKHGLTLEGENVRESFRTQILEGGLVEEWIFHRSEYVTSFVRQVHDMVITKHPGKLVSTAVFPDVAQTYRLKKQNIKAWLDSGYIDLVTPMVYFCEAEQIYDAVKMLKSMCGDARCYAGLYTTYHNQAVSELAAHIEACYNAGAEGFVLFNSAKTFYEAAEDYKGYLSKTYGRA